MLLGIQNRFSAPLVIFVPAWIACGGIHNLSAQRLDHGRIATKPRSSKENQVQFLPLNPEAHKRAKFNS